jgi:hypothetical protein
MTDESQYIRVIDYSTMKVTTYHVSAITDGKVTHTNYVVQEPSKLPELKPILINIQDGINSGRTNRTD